MTPQEGFGCSFAKLAILAGVVMKGPRANHLHSQHGDNIEENLSPRSVLEDRALSGLAIAIDLQEHDNKPSNTQHHVVLGRYCCKQNLHHGQEEHGLLTSSFHSRERLAHMTLNERERVSNAPSAGLRMAAVFDSIIPARSPGAKRPSHPETEDSFCSEKMSFKAWRCDETEQHVHTWAGRDAAKEQENVCPRKMQALMSYGSQTCNVKESQAATWKSHELTELARDEGRPIPGRSTEESIFYYVNPCSSDAFHIVTADAVSESVAEDFLKVCCFCRGHLGMGKDIYIYRGDQAFCSPECRYQQIRIDESESMDMTNE